MAEPIDVFISYKREDKARVDRLAELLGSIGIKNVWTDASLIAGEAWHARLMEQVRAARCVLVCWTDACADSPWVQQEMEVGRQRGVLLVTKFAPGGLPDAAGDLHCPDLSTWVSEGEHPGLRQLAAGLERYIDQPLQSRLIERIDGKNPAAVRLLRAKLVAIARRRGEPITYTDAYKAVAHIYADGTKTSFTTLYGTLDEIAEENRQYREPPLFGLVVKHEDGLPGRGYFQKHSYLPSEHHPLAPSLFKAHIEQVHNYKWPRDA